MSIEVRLRPARSKFGLRPWLVAAAIATIFPFATKAEEQGLVEIRDNDEIFQTYRERREGHGWLVGAGVENYKPQNFLSPVDGDSYETIFGGANIMMMSVEGGYKLNLGAISIGAVLGYAQGSVGGSSDGETRSLKVERTSLKGMLALDGITDEPLVAPYASFGLYRLGVDDFVETADLKFEGQTGTGTLLSIGALVQLNWLERASAREAWISSGLQNTYLDVFVTQLGKTSSDDDPDFSSAFNWGAALRLEF